MTNISNIPNIPNDQAERPESTAAEQAVSSFRENYITVCNGIGTAFIDEGGSARVMCLEGQGVVPPAQFKPIAQTSGPAHLRTFEVAIPTDMKNEYDIWVKQTREKNKQQQEVAVSSVIAAFKNHGISAEPYSVADYTTRIQARVPEDIAPTPGGYQGDYWSPFVSETGSDGKRLVTVIVEDGQIMHPEIFGDFLKEN